MTNTIRLQGGVEKRDFASLLSLIYNVQIQNLFYILSAVY